MRVFVHMCIWGHNLESDSAASLPSRQWSRWADSSAPPCWRSVGTSCQKEITHFCQCVRASGKWKNGGKSLVSLQMTFNINILGACRAGNITQDRKCTAESQVSPHQSIQPVSPCLKCISSGSVLWKYIGFKLVYFILVALENLIQTFLQISQLAPRAQCCEIAASPPTVLTSAPSDVWKLMPTNHALLREPSRTGCHWAHLLYPPTACRNTHTHTQTWDTTAVWRHLGKSCQMKFQPKRLWAKVMDKNIQFHFKDKEIQTNISDHLNATYIWKPISAMLKKNHDLVNDRYDIKSNNYKIKCILLHWLSHYYSQSQNYEMKS